MINIILMENENRSIALDENKEIGECVFEENNNIINIVHTGVESDYQGQGIARRLVNLVIDYSKKENKKVVATCSYAKKILEDNK